MINELTDRELVSAGMSAAARLRWRRYRLDRVLRQIGDLRERGELDEKAREEIVAEAQNGKEQE
jgi:hypothetical protein